RLLGVLLVERFANRPEARPARVEPRAARHHDALEERPVVGVEVDRQRHVWVLGEVERLPAFVPGSKVDPAVGYHLAHRDQMRHAATTRGGHAADTLALEESRHRFREAHRRQAFGAGVPTNFPTASMTAAGFSSGMKWPEPGTG